MDGAVARQGLLAGFGAGREPGRPVQVIQAVVRAYSGASHTATVQPLGSASTYLHEIKVSLEITSLTPGERVLVMLLDEHNPGDAVVLCRY